MTVEAAGGGIATLNDTYPAGGDTKSEGDNHIRLLKTELQREFPNFASSTPVTATQTELNYNAGVTPGTVSASKTIMAGASKNVDTLTIDTSFTLGSVNIMASVTGFTRGNVVYVDDEGDSQGGNFFDIDGNIGAAWESIGPTGSGATNIWTALDAIPSSAKYVIVRIRAQGTGATGGSGHDLYARKTGSSATTSGTDICSGIVPSNNGFYKYHTEATIPVDSSTRFDMYLNTSISPNLTMYLVGFGV